MLVNIVKILKLFSEYRHIAMLSIFIGFLTIGSSIGLMMTSAFIISHAALHVHINQLQAAIAGVRFFGVSRGVFRYLERLISHETTFKILAKLRYLFFKGLIPLFPSKIKDFKSGDMLSRAISDIEKLEHLFIRVIVPPTTALLVYILSFALLGMFSIDFSIIFSAFYLSAGIGVPLLTFFLSKRIGERTIALKSRLNSLTSDITRGMSELIFFNQEVKWTNEFIDLNQELLNNEKRMNSIAGLNDALTGFLTSAAVLAILISAIPKISSGNFEGVSLLVVVLGVMAAFEAVYPLPQTLQYLGETSEAAGRFIEMQSETQTQMPVKDEEILPEIFSIKFNAVSFNYDENKKVLDSCDFIIEENSINAIVGKSGEGKSTILKLLAGLWNPDSGEINLGNLKTSEMPEEKVREFISFVPQNPGLFTGTIKSNLLMGNENASEEEINNALRISQLLEFINLLPKGLNTEIGELGKTLSGGEMKRLALSRALLKNSKIIVCDELTSGLDPITEKKILNELKKLANDKTVILITHRLAEMRQYDKILYLENGKIVETGIHDDLMNLDHGYASFYNLYGNLLPFE